MSVDFKAGDRVFVKHPTQSWVTALVKSVTEATKSVPATYNVQCDDTVRGVDGKTNPEIEHVLEKVKLDDVTGLRDDLLDEIPDDLLSLTLLHDSTLLRCLYIRYMKDVVYTNIGAIVVALNPFNFFIPWYMDDQMPKYLAEGTIIEKNLPHSWAQAHNTYNEMIADSSNQCILISGESGAGKTEATKIVMKYLAQIASKQGTAEEREAGLQVGEKLKKCSPVLESFGNGRTVRNDNSSRFGKFMQVKFNSKNLLVGAFTIKYLLEKSRIVTASEGERCYHALYITTRGWAAEKLSLKPDTHYKSLNAGKTLHNGDYDTAEDFKEVTDAMSILGMTAQEIESVWKITGGILYLLNVEFEEVGEGSKVSAATRSDLDAGMKLWEVDGEKLEFEFRKTTLQIPGGQTAIKELNPIAAIDIRDATVKAVYNGLFGWLVEKCNAMCDVDASEGNWVGLLDIFGFEDFQKNSFEQMCINFANETLQNHYNTFIFTKDMEECRAEGIDVTEITCPDNMPCLNMIKGKGGVLDMLDEECMLGKGTDLTFLDKLNMEWEKKLPNFYGKPKMSKNEFIVHHYAASVLYDVNGWLEKNRDTVKDDIRIIVRNSSLDTIKLCLDPPADTGSGGKGRKVTVGGFFSDQMRLLMEVINSTSPHWIRTIKPHPAKKAKMFDGIQTMNQLESSGVLGTVKIRKAGYPIRQTFKKFNVRYEIIKGGTRKADGGAAESKAILEICKMNSKEWAQIGKTKVFMKAEAFPVIERKRQDAMLKYVSSIERVGRGYLSRMATCTARSVKIRQDFAKLCVEEYRAYMKRGAAVREERALLRAAAQKKFTEDRDKLQREVDDRYEKEFQSMWMSVLLPEYQAIQKHLEDEKERIQAAIERQKREAAAALEKAKKMQAVIAQKVQNVTADEEPKRRWAIEKEYRDTFTQITQLYGIEVRLFQEAEVRFTMQLEQNVRRRLQEQERERRSLLWEAFQRSHRIEAFDTLRYRVAAIKQLHPLSPDDNSTHGSRGQGFLPALEHITRMEIEARFHLEKRWWENIVGWTLPERFHRGALASAAKRLQQEAFHSIRETDIDTLRQHQSAQRERDMDVKFRLLQRYASVADKQTPALGGVTDRTKYQQDESKKYISHDSFITRENAAGSSMLHASTSNPHQRYSNQALRQRYSYATSSSIHKFLRNAQNNSAGYSLSDKYKGLRRDGETGGLMQPEGTAATDRVAIPYNYPKEYTGIT